jgi:ATP-binding cassette subfamily A (ABC1) protein 3
VKAVDDFSIKARKGQIMVLLGANGSGKSTTLDAIAGLNTITSGAIEIDGTGGLGLCPQKNVMWDELNVFEHVRIFNQLKSTGAYDSKDTIKDLIRACDLGHKIKAQSSTLSGGQKRKLQLAMMFTGGSKVCCVDEVSSGLDPLSRRKIWEILLAERGDRTFLLTTQFSRPRVHRFSSSTKLAPATTSHIRRTHPSPHQRTPSGSHHPPKVWSSTSLPTRSQRHASSTF